MDPFVPSIYNICIYTVYINPISISRLSAYAYISNHSAYLDVELDRGVVLSQRGIGDARPIQAMGQPFRVGRAGGTSTLQRLEIELQRALILPVPAVHERQVLRRQAQQIITQGQVLAADC